MDQTLVSISSTENLLPLQRDLIFSLWNQEYPAQLGYNAIEELDTYLDNLNNPRHYFASIKNTLVGWSFCFVREEEMWFAIIVDTRHQGKRIGTLLLNALKHDCVLLNGWVTDHNRYMKANGVPYPSPLAFYQKNGFHVLHDTRLEIPKLSAVKIQWQKAVY